MTREIEQGGGEGESRRALEEAAAVGAFELPLAVGIFSFPARFLSFLCLSLALLTAKHRLFTHTVDTRAPDKHTRAHTPELQRMDPFTVAGRVDQS